MRCDGARPYCQKCPAAGYDCEGYASWELNIRPKQFAAPVAVDLGTAVPQGGMNRIQLLSKFLATKKVQSRFAPEKKQTAKGLTGDMTARAAANKPLTEEERMAQAMKLLKF